MIAHFSPSSVVVLVEEEGILRLAEVLSEMVLSLCQPTVWIFCRSFLLLPEHVLQDRVELFALCLLQPAFLVLLILVKEVVSLLKSRFEFIVLIFHELVLLDLDFGLQSSLVDLSCRLEGILPQQVLVEFFEDVTALLQDRVAQGLLSVLSSVLLEVASVGQELVDRIFIFD